MITLTGTTLTSLNVTSYWNDNVAFSGDTATLTGSTLDIQGNWTCLNTMLTASTEWYLNIVGSATATGTTVDHSNADGGSQVNAFSSTDNGNNHNWLFNGITGSLCGSLELLPAFYGDVYLLPIDSGGVELLPVDSGTITIGGGCNG